MQLGSSGYVVIIEWDGEKPPTTYYNHLKRLILGKNAPLVRGDYDQGPLARRAAKSDKGVIFQEGCIICGSESLAYAIANLAKMNGATFVQLGKVELAEVAAVADSGDDEMMAHLQSVLGKRGRPTERHDWAVSCFEELAVAELYQESDVLNCPSCHGLRIRSRRGGAKSYAPPAQSLPSDEALSYWRSVRFEYGYFHFSRLDDFGGKPADPKPAITDVRDMAMWNTIASSDLSFLEGLPARAQVKLLDAIFSSRSYIPAAVRLEHRVKAIATTLMRVEVKGGIRMGEDPDEVDLWDAAYHIGAGQLYNMFIMLNPTVLRIT
jgi:hypothetical protein